MTPEYDEYGVLIKRKLPEVDEYNIPIKKKSGGGVSTSGAGTTTTSTSSGDFPLLYDRKKTASMPALLAGNHPLPEKKVEPIIFDIKSVKPALDKTIPMADEGAQEEAINQIAETVNNRKTDDPLKEIIFEGKDYGQNNYKVFTEKLKLVKNAFPTGTDAKEYLNRTLQIDPFNNDVSNVPTEELMSLAKGNVTKEAAIKRLEDSRNVEQALKGRTLDEASLIYAANKDPQVKFLLDKAGGVGGFDEQTSAIPLSMRGEKKLQFLMNPDVRELVQSNPQLKQEYDNEIANFPGRHPEFATKLLADAIAKKREETGGNNWFANVVGKEATDKVVDELIADGTFPESYRYLYKQTIRPKLGTAQSIGRGIGNAIPGINQLVNEAPIPTPGVLENFEQGFENFQIGTAKSIANITGIQGQLQPEAQQIFNTLEKEYLTPQLEPTSLGHKTSLHGGNLLGFVAGLVGGTSALNATKLLNPQVAQATSMVLATHGDSNERAKTLFPGEKLKQGVYVGAMDALNGVLGKYLPGQQIPKLLKPSENIIASTLNKMVDGEITTGAAKNVIVDAVSNTIKGSLKGGEFMGAIAGIDDLLTQTLQGKGIDFSQSVDKAWDSFKIGFMATAPLSAMEAGLKSNKPFRNEIISIADNPEYYKQLANREAEVNPDFAKIKDEVIENIDYVSKVKQEVAGMKPKEQSNYVINSLAEKVKLTKAEQATDPTIKKRLQKEAKNISEIKDAALRGIPEEKVKENQAIKDVKELYDLDYISGNSKKALETAEGENSKPKFDENKVKGFLEEVAQQANNVMSDKKVDKNFDSRKAAKSKYPSQLIDLANDMFPEYKKISEEADYEAANKITEPVELDPTLPEGFEMPKVTAETEVTIPGIKSNVPTEPIIPPKENENVSYVFSENKDLSNIGTPNEYYDYLKSVFPNSVVNGKLFFHRGGAKVDKFDKSKLKPHESAFYFKDNLKSDGYGEGVTAAILDIAKPSGRYPHENVPKGTDASIVRLYEKDADVDPTLKEQGKTADDLVEYGVYAPEQIHILGSKEDIAGFKKWKSKNETSNTKGGNNPNESIPTKKEGGAIETPPEVIEGAKAEAGEGAVELSHKGLQEVANEFSLPAVTKRERKTDIKLREDAKSTTDKWVKDGIYGDKVEGLIKKAEALEVLTDEERIILEGHLANVTEQLRGLAPTSAEFDTKLSEIKRLKDAGQKTRSAAGAALRLPGGGSRPDASLANAMIAKSEANDNKPLTDTQKEQVATQYEKIDKSKKSLSAKGKELADKIRALRPKTQNIQSNFFGLPIAVYDTSLVIVANAVEGGAKLADAIQQGIKHIKDNGGFKDKREEKNYVAFLSGKSTEEQRLESYKKRLRERISEMRGKTAARDFEKDPKSILELDAEAEQLRKEYRTAKSEFELELQKDKLKNRPLKQKVIDALLEPFRAVRTILTSFDFSAPLRQGIVPTISHPTMAAKAFPEMFKQAFSKGRFDTWLADLKDSPVYPIMEKSGLYIADPNNLHLSAKEEQFMSNLAEKIPIIGKAVKGSERAYVSYLNKMRSDLFKQGIEVFMIEGKTPENSPELYEGLANYINNSTGRGKLGPLEGSAQALNTVFFSPRLMASRINTLGLTDAFTLGQNGFYSKLPPEVRKMAVKDMMKFIGFGVSVLALAKLNGADVEDDPRSTDFGKIKVGNTRWDIWGGYQPYVRLISQLATGKSKSTSTGQLRDLKTEEKSAKPLAFLRGKLAPVPSSIYDLYVGENIVGEPATIKSEVLESITPMLYRDVQEAMKDQGIKALFTVGIPASLGIGTNTYEARTPSKPSRSNKKPAKRTTKAN